MHVRESLPCNETFITWDFQQIFFSLYHPFYFLLPHPVTYQYLPCPQEYHTGRTPPGTVGQSSLDSGPRCQGRVGSGQSPWEGVLNACTQTTWNKGNTHHGEMRSIVHPPPTCIHLPLPHTPTLPPPTHMQTYECFLISSMLNLLSASFFSMPVRTKIHSH